MTICIARSCLPLKWARNHVGLHQLVERANAKSTRGRIKCERPTFRSAARRRSVRQLGQPPLEKPALGLLPGERERALVGGARLRGLAQPPAQVGARGVGQVVVLADRRARGWRRSGPDPRRDRRASPPPRRGSARPPATARRAAERRRARRSRPSRSRRRWPHRRGPPRSPPGACRDRSAATRALLSPAPTPPRSDRGSRASGPGRRAGPGRPSGDVRAARRDSCSSISASSPIASGSGSNSTSSRPRRIASPDRSTRVSDCPDDAE